MVLNRYPMWKNLLVLLVMIIACVYAAPIFFGDDPAVQISGSNAAIVIDQATIDKVKQTLQAAGAPYKSMDMQDRSLLVRFSSEDVQLKAKEQIQEALGNDYLVAFNLAPRT